MGLENHNDKKGFVRTRNFSILSLLVDRKRETLLTTTMSDEAYTRKLQEKCAESMAAKRAATV